MSKHFGKVAVLFGGTSSEREVSLMSGAGVLKALQSQGIDAHAFDPASQPLQALKDKQVDCAFVALHGRGGEDGTLQGALEWLGIPYTGSGVKASAIAMDKVATKQIWLQQGLSTPEYRELASTLSGSLLEQALAELPNQLGLPFIMKPPHEGSTIGFSKIDYAHQSTAAFALASKLDTSVLAESFVPGRELTVTILGGGSHPTRALPVIEICAPQGNYDFQNKYYTNDTQYLCPAPLSESLTKAIQALAIKAYDALGCEGWGRVDVMLKDDLPFLLEVNTSPGMTSHSLVPMAAKAIGISYEALCVEVLSTANLKTLVHQGDSHVA
jgi:D-alanine-D-alanine ligase